MSCTIDKCAEEISLDQETIAEDTSSSVDNIDTSDTVDDDPGFQDIILLLEHGITQDDINKFTKVGINTIQGIQMQMQKNLKDMGISDAKIQLIRDACAQLSAASLRSCVFMTGVEVSDQRKQIFKLETGSKNLNKLLGGGVEAMSITEVFGEFGSGKTQLAHTLCVTAQLPGPNGYLGGKVIFIDTEHTFRPDRIRKIAERFNLDQTRVLENILYARAFNSEQQFDLLKHVAAKMHSEAGIFKLLIMDSIMALFRVDYSGIGEMAERQKRLGLMLSRLQKMSEEYNIAVFITNQITSDFTAIRDEVKPIGGHIMAHSSTTRVALKKSIGNCRIAFMLDSPELESLETEFAITIGGIDDPSHLPMSD